MHTCQPLNALRRRSLALCALLLTVGAAPATRAAKPKPAPPLTPEEKSAKQIHMEGTRLFDKGLYAEALTRFESAYAVFQNDAIRYFLARTYAVLGRCEQALPLLNRLQGRVPEAAQSGLRAAEFECLLKVVQGHLDKFLCHKAAEGLKALDTLKPAPPAPVPDALTTVEERTASCTFYFDTSLVAGKAAARMEALARKRLRQGSLDAALRIAGQSLMAAPSGIAELTKAEALARLGRCDEARPLLDGLVGRLRENDDAARRDAITDCNYQALKGLLGARREAVDAMSCHEAEPLLRGLTGQLQDKREQWRAAKEKQCVAVTSDFPTDTSMRQAAHRLFLSAKEAAKSRATLRAIDLFEKALKLADEPVIRRLLSVVFGRLGRCRDVAKMLAGIPKQQRSAGERAQLAACTQYAPTKKLKRSQRWAHLRDVSQGLVALGRKDFNRGLPMLGRAVAAGRSVKLWARYLKALHNAKRCKEFIAELDRAPNRSVALPNASGLRASCQAILDGRATKTVVADLDANGPEATAWKTSFGYAAITAGALLVVGSAVSAYYYFDSGSGSEPSDHAMYQVPLSQDGGAAQAVGASDQQAVDDAHTTSTLAWVLGSVGVGALVAGIVLVLVDEPPEPSSDDGVRLVPSAAVTQDGVRLLGSVSF